MTTVLNSGSTDLTTLEFQQYSVPSSELRQVAIVANAAKAEHATFRVNTSFSELGWICIFLENTVTLQCNLIFSYFCGVFKTLDQNTICLMMTLKLPSLGHKNSDVRWLVCTQIEAMVAQGVIPVIPAKDRFSTSVYMILLAHLAAIMIGAYKARFDGNRLPGGTVLEQAKLFHSAWSERRYLANQWHLVFGRLRAMMSENNHRANPCSIHRRSPSANQKNHVSISAHYVRWLIHLCGNLIMIVSITVICLVQRMNAHISLSTSAKFVAAIQRLLKEIPAFYSGPTPLARSKPYC
ncbi:MAG: aromatic amino acid lyase [Aestuariivita sp.]|nr:aromatic amino acid lyase [Aestuariivita sp.]